MRKIVAGLLAIVALFSCSLAIQRTFLSEGLDDVDDVRRPASPAPAASVVRVSTASDVEDVDASDRADSSRSLRSRGRAIRQGARPAPGQSAAASSEIRRFEPGDSGWFSPVPTLARWFTSGGAGAAGAPASRTPDSSSQVAARPQPGRAQVREVYFGTREDTACQPGDRQFPLGDVRDLYVCVVWSGVAGKYVEQLTFVSPDGNAYQTLTVPFLTAGAAAADPSIEIDGRRLDAKAAGWGANGDALVTAVLPVAGTFITQRTLVGTWTVEVRLNGQRIDEDNFELFTP